MNKAITIIGIFFLIGIFTGPVMAWGPHWGGGHHMMGYWGNGHDDEGKYYGNLTPEQAKELKALDRKFYDDTRDLRANIQSRYEKLDNIMSSNNPDLDKAKAIQNEISDLHAKLDNKRLTYNLEVRKIVPDRELGYGNGGFYGHHMTGAHGSMMGY